MKYKVQQVYWGAIFAYTAVFQGGCMDWKLHCVQGKNPSCDVEIVDEYVIDELVTDEVWAPSPQCPEDVELVSYEVAIEDDCSGEPEIGTMTPNVEWVWNHNEAHPGLDQVMAMPIAGNMTDDNGDGVIGVGDVPDVAFTSFRGSGYPNSGALNVLSGDTGELIWSQTSIDGHKPEGATGVALADLGDGQGLGLFLMTSGGLTAVNVDGTHRWTTTYNDSSLNGWTSPSVYDMEGDGVAEVIVGRSVFEADGTLRWRGGAGSGSRYHISFAMDLDEDGLAELIAGDTIYNYDGSIRSFSGTDGFTAAADLNADGRPDIIIVTNSWVHAKEADGTALWSVSYASAGLYGVGGGAPTIADFDGDGLPEVGVASSSFYRVFNGSDGSLLWEMPIIDPSSNRTASSVFDFEGDGAAEVVYADEHTLWVFDGATGAVELEWAHHSSGTLVEYPVIVDIDNDGSSEIILASTNYQSTGSADDNRTGITVIGDLNDSWSAARPIWNQHAYSIANINDDGTVPTTHPKHWLSSNSFRAGNSETRTGFTQFDLRVGTPEYCLDECAQGRALVWIPIENGGHADASDIQVTIHTTDAQGEAVRLDMEHVSLMQQGEQVWFDFPVTLAVTDFEYGPVTIEIRSQQPKDDECRDDNNVYVIESWPCDL